MNKLNNHPTGYQTTKAAVASALETALLTGIEDLIDLDEFLLPGNAEPGDIFREQLKAIYDYLMEHDGAAQNLFLRAAGMTKVSQTEEPFNFDDIANELGNNQPLDWDTKHRYGQIN